MKIGGEMEVKKKRSAGKRKRTGPVGKVRDMEQCDRMVVSQRAVAAEVSSVGGKIIVEETIVSTEKQKGNYTAVTSMGTQTVEWNIKEESVEEKVWKKDEISCSREAREDCGRNEIKDKTVGLDESREEYDATIKREVMDGEGTLLKVKWDKTFKRTMAEEREINELLTGGNVSGHKTGKGKKQKAGRASRGLELDTRGAHKARSFGGAEKEASCLERECGSCKALAPVHGLGERDFTRKRCQLDDSVREAAEGGDAESMRPRRSQENMAGVAMAGAEVHLPRKRRRKKCPEEGLVGAGAAEEEVEMHESHLEMPTSHAEVVFLSEKLGDRDEVVIDQARRLALQREIDLASC